MKKIFETFKLESKKEKIIVIISIVLSILLLFCFTKTGYLISDEAHGKTYGMGLGILIGLLLIGMNMMSMNMKIKTNLFRFTIYDSVESIYWLILVILRFISKGNLEGIHTFALFALILRSIYMWWVKRNFTKYFFENKSVYKKEDGLFPIFKVILGK